MDLNGRQALGGRSQTRNGGYGGMTVSQAARLRTLEDENRRLKKLLAESMPRRSRRLQREDRAVRGCGEATA
ncbi:hypothetical protein [Sphingomonas sp. DBB INV C78]|uniref:hypothetical protein n=1 Tax=Sphingomonas sp. DBB INV C78 TaxID=3349434 RepID=UPI0036D2324F